MGQGIDSVGKVVEEIHYDLEMEWGDPPFLPWEA